MEHTNYKNIHLKSDRLIFAKISPVFLFLEFGNCESEYHKRHGKIEIRDCSSYQFNYEVSLFILQIPIGTYLDIY